MTDEELIAKGREIVESGKHAPKRGEYLSRLWGVLDVYEGSPQPWKDALMAERSRDV